MKKIHMAYTWELPSYSKNVHNYGRLREAVLEGSYSIHCLPSFLFFFFCCSDLALAGRSCALQRPSPKTRLIVSSVCLVPIIFNVIFVCLWSKWCGKVPAGLGGHLKVKAHRRHSLFCHQAKSSQKSSKWPQSNSSFTHYQCRCLKNV